MEKVVITEDIRYVGVIDSNIDLFEGQYMVTDGMTYNSYVILDDKIAVMDSVDAAFGEEWLENIGKALDGRKPDYLVISHMEPDHSANIELFTRKYPDAALVGNAKTFAMLDQFYSIEPSVARVTVVDRQVLELGKHSLQFVFAPMVHWPEVMVSYEATDKVLFSADGFGRFGSIDEDEEWDCEARRYYFGIVGKYGAMVQKLLGVAKTLDIRTICPLHGPVLKGDLSHYIKQYDTWSSYEPESKGVMIAYASVYGNTQKAAELLADKLKEKGCEKVVIADLTREDLAECVEDAFRFDRLVLASITYNGDVFPCMKTFINSLTERGYQKRTVGLVENGSWGPTAAKVMASMLEGSKNLTLLDDKVTIRSAVNDDVKGQIDRLAESLCR